MIEERRFLALHSHRYFPDDEWRRKWQNPEQILPAVGLKAGHIFVDVGCGEGFFAIPAGKIVGDKGKVYGVDKNADAVRALAVRVKIEQLGNVVLKIGAAEDTVFCEKCADFVFFGIVLHDFRNPRKVLLNARMMLKPDGKLVDFDWKKKPMQFGPPLEIRFAEKTAVSLIKSTGYFIEQVKGSGPYNYIVIARQRNDTFES